MISKWQREEEDFIFATQLNDLISDGTTQKIIANIYFNGNISFNKLIEKTKVKPKVVDPLLSELIKKRIIDCSYRRGSPIQRHFKVTDFGEEVIDNLFEKEGEKKELKLREGTE